MTDKQTSFLIHLGIAFLFAIGVIGQIMYFIWSSYANSVLS